MTVVAACPWESFGGRLIRGTSSCSLLLSSLPAAVQNSWTCSQLPGHLAQQAHCHALAAEPALHVATATHALPALQSDRTAAPVATASCPRSWPFVAHTSPGAGRPHLLSARSRGLKSWKVSGLRHAQTNSTLGGALPPSLALAGSPGACRLHRSSSRPSMGVTCHVHSH